MIQGYWAGVKDIESDPFLYEEPPYYYAMCIAHHPQLGDNRVDWYRDPALWPPPLGWRFG